MLHKIGQKILEAAHVKLVDEKEWNAADDAIDSSYDALLSCKEFLETLQIIAPFEPNVKRLKERLKDVSESVESTLLLIERYQETGRIGG